MPPSHTVKVIPLQARSEKKGEVKLASALSQVLPQTQKVKATPSDRAKIIIRSRKTPTTQQSEANPYRRGVR